MVKKAAMSITRIAELATSVSTNTAKVDEYLKSHSRPSPSFDVDHPADLGIPPEAIDIDNARKAALEASIELQDLLQGPTSLLRPVVCFQSKIPNSFSTQLVYHKTTIF